MKIWTQSCRFSLRTRKSSKTQGNFHLFFIFSFFLSFFYHFFHFPCPWHLKSRKAMKNNEKQWKTMEKKNEVANEKKMKIWTQSCRFSLQTRKSSKTRGNFHFFRFFSILFFLSFFFHFPCPWHLKSRKAMKNNRKPSKKQGKMKKNEVANEKKRKFGLKVADSHSKPGNLQKLAEIFLFFHFYIFLSFFYHCFFHFPCPWHLKSRKAMKNNGKQWKTIKNKRK